MPRQTEILLDPQRPRRNPAVEWAALCLRSAVGGLLLDVAAPSLGAPEDEPQILSVRVRLRRSGREIRMVIDGADPFAGLQFQGAAS